MRMSRLRTQVILLKKFYICLITSTIFILSALHIAVHSRWKEYLFTLVGLGDSSLSSDLCSGIIFFFFFLVKSYCTSSGQNQSLFFPIPWHCNCIFRSVRAGGPSHLLSHSSPQMTCWLDQSDLEDRNRVFIVINNKAHRTGVKKCFGIQQT